MPPLSDHAVLAAVVQHLLQRPYDDAVEEESSIANEHERSEDGEEPVCLIVKFLSMFPKPGSEDQPDDRYANIDEEVSCDCPYQDHTPRISTHSS